MDTPRGRYAIVGLEVIRVGADGSLEDVVHSMGYLKGDGNVWVQRVSTEKLDEPREIASRPLGIVYDDRTGNLVIALGIQGVVVGTPDGEWVPAAVGQFEPTDFSFVGKTRLLLSDLEFWTAALAVCVSMTAFGLTASQYRLGDLLQTVAIILIAVCAVVGLAAGLVFKFSSLSESLIPLFLMLTGTFAPLAIIGAAICAHTESRYSRAGRFVIISLVLLAALASGGLMFMFGFSDDSATSSFSDAEYIVVAVATWFLGISSLAASSQQMVRRWRLVALSLAGMVTLVILAFMLWLHLGVDEVVTKAAAIGLCGIAAIVLAGYIARTALPEAVPCPTCGRHAMAQDTYCINCGAP